MQHQPSPLLHDYKLKERQSQAPSRPVRWFAAGLGFPLLLTGAFLLIGGDDDAVESPALPMPATSGLESVAADDTAAIESAVFVPDSDEPLPAEPEPAFHPPLNFPDAEFESLLVTVKRGDTMEKIFRRHGLALTDLAAIASLPEAAEQLRMLRPGDDIEIRHDDDRLIRLQRNIELTSALLIERAEDGFEVSVVDRPVDIRRKSAYGRIETSLFESAADAGLSDKTIMNLAGIFAWDIDFVLDIRGDDNYYIIYEELWQDGEFVSDGEIVAAEFNNTDRSYRAVRFVDESGRSDYFTPEGRSVRKAFIRAPVDFTRISSRFNPNRRHPILNTIRAHRGVDYAAPRGTPVKAAGDGKVIFRGVQGGYGNAVILQHGGNITTLYAHLNAFDRQAGYGKRVVQGQTIGYVGDTGLATAPHLHYEYRLNGVHRNPRTVSLPQAEPIKAEYMQEFLATATPVLEELQRFKRTRVASATAD